MQNNEYWRANIRLMSILLVIWFTVSFGFVIEQIRLWILGNINITNPDFPIDDPSVGFVDRALPRAQRFHFTSHQLDSTLNFIEDLIVVACLTIF